ncbi:MAG: hypothetical protein HKN49_12190 [Gammaproteobacteria bacterium]|nr:hypothetical protein [Gammaproteobacteria bacterium]
MPNVVVLTAGLAGSSVVTGLLARGGLWTGHETFRKSDYDTHENLRLIELNRKLFDSVGFDGNYESEYPDWVAEAIQQKSADIDQQPFVDFIADCNAHQPWIWKDPRLSLTLGGWARWLDLPSIHFVLVRREPLQSWVSNIRRRHIESYRYHREYNESIWNRLEAFCREREAPYLPLVYEDLMVQPEQTLERLNQFLHLQLDLTDLQAVFSGKLGRRQHGVVNFTNALAIYLKNFGQRRTA